MCSSPQTAQNNTQWQCRKNENVVAYCISLCTPTKFSSDTLYYCSVVSLTLQTATQLHNQPNWVWITPQLGCEIGFKIVHNLYSSLLWRDSCTGGIILRRLTDPPSSVQSAGDSSMHWSSRVHQQLEVMTKYFC